MRDGMRERDWSCIFVKLKNTADIPRGRELPVARMYGVEVGFPREWFHERIHTHTTLPLSIRSESKIYLSSLSLCNAQQVRIWLPNSTRAVLVVLLPRNAAAPGLGAAVRPPEDRRAPGAELAWVLGVSRGPRPLPRTPQHAAP